MKSLSIGTHFEPFCAVVSRVMSHLSSLWDLSGCRYASRSSSHLLAGIPCFRYPSCLVDVAGLQLETSLVQRSS